MNDMTTPTQHTAEPWRVRSGRYVLAIDADEMTGIADLYQDVPISASIDDAISEKDKRNAASLANAARIVTCVNALAGISDPAATLKAVREALDGAETTFLLYAEMHYRKGTPDGDKKAEANLAEARKLLAALRLLTPNQDAKA